MPSKRKLIEKLDDYMECILKYAMIISGINYIEFVNFERAKPPNARHERYKQIYLAAQNIAVFLLTPYFLLQMERVYAPAYIEEGLSQDINVMHTLSFAYSTTMILARRWPAEQVFKRIARRMQKLDAAHFPQLLNRRTFARTHSWRLLLMEKTLNMFVFLGLFICAPMNGNWLKTWHPVVGVYYSVALFTGKSICVQCFYCIGHINLRLELLHMQLKAERIRKHEKVTRPLLRILRVLGLMATFMQEIEAMWNYSTMAVILMFFVYTITMIYFNIIIFFGGIIKIDTIAIVILCVFFFLMFLAILLFFSLCEQVLKTVRQIKTRVKEKTESNRSLEFFCFNFYLRTADFHLRVFNMFKVNVRSVFNMFLTIQFYILFLIQSDYSTLFGKLSNRNKN